MVRRRVTEPHLRERKLAPRVRSRFSNDSVGCSSLPRDQQLSTEIVAVREASKPTGLKNGGNTLHDEDLEVDVSFTEALPSGNLNESTTDFPFSEYCCLSLSSSEVLCCHFSSDSRLLALAGHEERVTVWDMDEFKYRSSSEEHGSFITDVRFRPQTCQLATSSFDTSIRIWDATELNHSICQLAGHMEPVMSLDFHPKKNLLCSCDYEEGIRLWDINQGSCLRASKGGSTQIRFHPEDGHLITAACGNMVNLIDVETNQLQFTFQGHTEEVMSICWERSGQHIGTLIWSVATGKCMHELLAAGKKFHSCTFHHPSLVLVGADQTIDLWHSFDGRTITYPAHKKLIAALSSSSTGKVASASHDHRVKVWNCEKKAPRCP